MVCQYSKIILGHAQIPAPGQCFGISQMTNPITLKPQTLKPWKLWSLSAISLIMFDNRASWMLQSGQTTGSVRSIRLPSDRTSWCENFCLKSSKPKGWGARKEYPSSGGLVVKQQRRSKEDLTQQTWGFHHFQKRTEWLVSPPNRYYAIGIFKGCRPAADPGEWSMNETKLASIFFGASHF